jgi:hypothetical protein
LLGSGVGSRGYNNIIHSNGKLTIDPGTGAAVAGGGMRTGFNATDCELTYNTLYNNGTNFNAAHVRSGSTRSVVRNNLFANNPVNAVLNQGSSSVISNNPATTAPLFVNVSAWDFHLLAGSPAISAGVALALSVDFDGVSRGAPPDAGAYEYVP